MVTNFDIEKVKSDIKFFAFYTASFGNEEVAKFIQEETLNVIGECLNNKLPPSQVRYNQLCTPVLL